MSHRERLYQTEKFRFGSKHHQSLGSFRSRVSCWACLQIYHLQKSVSPDKKSGTMCELAVSLKMNKLGLVCVESISETGRHEREELIAPALAQNHILGSK